MSEHLFNFLNGFQKRSSSTQQPAKTNKSTACFMIIAISRFYGIMLSRCSRMEIIIRIKIITAIFIRAMKERVRSSWLKREKLSRWIKYQNIKSQNTIVLKRLIMRKKYSKQNKNDHQNDDNYSANKNSSAKWNYHGQDCHLPIKSSKKLLERATRVRQIILLVVKNIDLMRHTLQRRKSLNNSKLGEKSRGGMVTIPPDPQKWKFRIRIKKQKRPSRTLKKIG